MTSPNIIYLDNNATTPIDPRVLDAMMPYLTNEFANANSTHKFGLNVDSAVKSARKSVADLIGAEANEIIFTSGATEAINLAIKGVAESYRAKGNHIITVSTEHHAVLDTCKYLETRGIEVTYLPVDRFGLVDLYNLESIIKENTIMISVMMVNNETGVIQPIKEIGDICRKYDLIFFSDCTQAVGKMPVNVDELNIDLLAMSAHKFYGPKGIGALFFRQRKPNRIKLTAMQHGGGHERNIRSGTLNVPGIVGLGKACEIAKKEMSQNETKIREMRDYLESELLKIEGAFINGHREKRLYNTINICFPGVDSEALILALSNPEDENDPMICVSNGSACSSNSYEPSHVLSAMFLNRDAIYSCIRISMNQYTTNAYVERVEKLIIKLIVTLMAMNTSLD